MKRFFSVAILFVVSFLSFQRSAFSYPQRVVDTINLSLGSTITGLAITDTSTNLFVSYADVLNIVDLGIFGLAAVQPPALSTTNGTEGNINAVGFVPSNNQIYAEQENGNVLDFDFGQITNTPLVYTVASGKVFKPAMAVDTTTSPPTLYLADDADSLIFVWPVGSTTAQQINLKQVSALSNAAAAFHILSMAFSPFTHEVYISTDYGVVVWMSTSDPTNITNNGIVLDPPSTLNPADISALAVMPDGSKVFAASPGFSSTIGGTVYPTVFDISTSSHTASSFNQLIQGENTAFTSMAILNVAGGIYGFVSGSKGVTVFDTLSDIFIDVNPDNVPPPLPNSFRPIATNNSGPMIASTPADGYIYIMAGSGLSIITENPYISPSSLSVVYTDSTGAATTMLKKGGLATVSFQATFQSATDAGTYQFRSGGSIDRSGQLMTDSSGHTSGPVPNVAPGVPPVTVVFSYDSILNVMQGGDNTVFVFVTANSNTNLIGRLAFTLTVDIPPGPITIASTGFGNSRAYLNFARLTAKNISSYNLYADTDPNAVQTKTTTSGTIAQPASGGTVTAPIDGLTNGTTYYLAVEGVSTSGTIGPRAFLLPDGTPASAIPQQTVGPAAFSGETGGCSLIMGER